MLAIVMAPVLAKLADVSFKIWRDEDLEGLFPLHESFFFFSMHVLSMSALKYPWLKYAQITKLLLHKTNEFLFW